MNDGEGKEFNVIQTDNLCKYLAEKYPLDFAEWVLGQRPTEAEILKTGVLSAPKLDRLKSKKRFSM